MLAQVLFMDIIFDVPQIPLAEWPDGTLIDFIDRWEAELDKFPMDAALPLNDAALLFFDAWLELDSRTGGA